MSETEDNASPIEYESGESTAIIVPKGTKEAIAEGDIEESLYGKNKPRRVKIDRKIANDESK
jgi:hypothetical protein